MDYLGIDVRTHRPQSKDGRKVTARAKGKVERPFRTVKEMHETLFHFHKPETEREANDWLRRFLVRYNDMQHRSEPHSRLEDWLANLPAEGIREMYEWTRFCTFAREPERRLVGVDARIVIGTTQYEVDPNLAGETVILWWGLFDTELYIEQGERRYGPYTPVGGPVPLHRYRRFQKTRTEQRAERVEALAERLAAPLQIERYLTLAFEQAHEIAEKPVSAGLVDSVLTPGLNDLEPRLARHGYNAKILAQELDIRPAEVRSFLRGTLPPGRTEEIHKQLLAKGIPA